MWLVAASIHPSAPSNGAINTSHKPYIPNVWWVMSPVWNTWCEDVPTCCDLGWVVDQPSMNDGGQELAIPVYIKHKLRTVTCLLWVKCFLGHPAAMCIHCVCRVIEKDWLPLANNNRWHSSSPSADSEVFLIDAPAAAIRHLPLTHWVSGHIIPFFFFVNVVFKGHLCPLFEYMQCMWE